MEDRGEIEENCEHHLQCPDCGGWFDMRDLAAVFAHQHWLETKPPDVHCSHVQQAGKPEAFFVKKGGTILTLRYKNGQGGRA